MVTQITLGNIFKQNDRTVVGGGPSGLDTESLINGLVEARRQPAVVMEKNLEKNKSVTASLGELKDLLSQFKDAAKLLRNPPGVQNDADNIFQFRSAEVSSNTTVAGSTYVKITAAPGASATTYDVSVTQLATRSIYTTNTFSVATADTALVGSGGTEPIQAGTLTLGANATPVTLTSGDTLNQVVSKINAARDLSGVEAVAVKVANGQYRLSLKSIETGASQNYTPTPAIFAPTGFAVTENAVDAIIEFDGTTITRSSNAIDDVVENVTFNLLQTTPPGTELKVELKPDTELAKQGILNFVNAYNEFRLFTASQTETGDDGKPVESAVLSSSSALTLTKSRVDAEIASIVNGITGGDPARLADIGITFTDFPGDDENPFTRNILTVDEDKLTSVLSSDFDAVRKVFEFDYSSDNPNLQIFQRTNGLKISSFALSINQTTGVYEASYDDDNDPLTANVVVGLDGTPAASGTGVLLKGRAGTVLDGLTLIYGAAGDTTVNLSISQGIGDRVYNTLDDLLDEDTGAITTELTALSDKNDRIKKDISRIDDELERYRDRLLSQFGALEKAITSANTLLATLEAQSNARQQ